MMLLTMIFFHIIDDYYLQGILAQMKQKKFWEDNAPDEMYKYDYIWALTMHAFSWTFMIMLPIAFFYPTGFLFFAMFALNVATHAWVDNLKANRHEINLWQDQLLHMIQIVLTFIVLV